jgi:hypothetical protein
MKTHRALPIMIGIFVVGLVIGWAFAKVKTDRDIRDLALSRQLATAGLCAGSLQMIDEDNPTTLRTLLYSQLESSVTDADRLVSEGARLREAVPNLRETARRSAEYLAATGSEVAGRAEALAHTIEQ